VNFKCVNDLDCQEFDKNQVCNNSCICNQKYNRNVSTNLCSDKLIGETGLETNFDDKNVFKENEKKSFLPLFFPSKMDPKSSLERLYNCFKKGCNNDSDCQNCDLINGRYCVDNKCSFNCKSVREGDSCDYEIDCNPMCDIYSFSSKKYCVDKKCSIFKTNPFKSSGNKDFNWVFFGGIMFIVLIVSIAGIAFHCCKHYKKEAFNRNRVSNLNSLRNSTGNTSQLQSNHSRTISTSDQRNIREATHFELNQMRSTSSRNRAIDDPPPSYAQVIK
jgi:hypothetical protein